MIDRARRPAERKMVKFQPLHRRNPVEYIDFHSLAERNPEPKQPREPVHDVPHPGRLAP